MRAVALLLSISLLGCFPHDRHAQTTAKLVEGGSILAGIGINFLVNTGADCDAMAMPGVQDNCHTKGAVIGDIGFAMILAGVVGFIATISTADDENKPEPPPIDIKATPAPTADKTTGAVATPPPLATAGTTGSVATPTP